MLCTYGFSVQMNGQVVDEGVQDPPHSEAPGGGGTETSDRQLIHVVKCEQKDL